MLDSAMPKTEIGDGGVLSENRPMQMQWCHISMSLSLVFSLACSNDKPTADDETGADSEGAVDTGESGSMSTSGDGDGDTDPGDGDGDTDPGDGDGDPCPIGLEGCPCTGGGGCDPGLMCDAGICVSAAGDGDGDGDGGGDGDGDGGPMPYGPCPSGDDAECLPGETCQTGVAQNINFELFPWSLCTTPCTNPLMPVECVVNDTDWCESLPGNGTDSLFCNPSFLCLSQPCPVGMYCVPGGQVCVWPD
jgi:hypothetical protein